jgi:hypothetical protein
VELFKQGVEGATAKDVMILVLLTQYFDTLKDIGSSGHSNTILMPHSPGALKDFFDQIRNAIVLGEAVAAPQSPASGSPAHGA